jgi:hypothetical protein
MPTGWRGGHSTLSRQAGHSRERPLEAGYGCNGPGESEGLLGQIMGRLRQHLTLLGPFGALMTMAGCASREAPSLILAGAYFPGWILCGVAGVLAAIVARIAMVMSGLSDALPLQLFVCVALGNFVAIAAWLFWFGQ